MDDHGTVNGSMMQEIWIHITEEDRCFVTSAHRRIGFKSLAEGDKVVRGFRAKKDNRQRTSPSASDR